MGIASLHPSYEGYADRRIIFMHDVAGFPPLTFAAKARNKGQKCPGRTAVHKGRVVFGAMDEVVFGRPASEAIVEQLNRLGAKRAFLMVSGTLNRETDEIENIRRVLGPRCVGTFDAMPPHTPRAAVIAAAEQARAAEADLIVTIGGGGTGPGRPRRRWTCRHGRPAPRGGTPFEDQAHHGVGHSGVHLSEV